MARRKARKARTTRSKAAAPARRRRLRSRRVRAASTAPRRRVSARRRARNPKGIFKSPAVELGVSAVAGVALGAAADSIPRWSWLPEQIQAGHVVGAVLAFGGWKLAKGKWRQRLIAAGIGAAGQSFARGTIAPAVAGMFGGAESGAFPRSAKMRYLSPAPSSRMGSQSAALVANGIPV